MPKSRQRKAHKEKKKKFVKAQLQAKELYAHRMQKYTEQLNKMFKEQYEAKMLKEAAAGTVIDSPIEGTVNELTELSKEMSAEYAEVVNEITIEEDMPGITPPVEEQNN